MTLSKKIEHILRQRFSPTFLEIIDESSQHAHHGTGEKKGGNYQVTIVSQLFTEKSSLQRQREVYQALSKEFSLNEIHALVIHAYTPEQWKAFSNLKSG